MAISFVGSASNSGGGGDDVTVTLPSGMAQDDLVIVTYGIGDNDNVDFTMAMVTTGYTGIADLYSPDTRNANLGVFRKFMGATPDTTAIVDGLGGIDASVSAVCIVFRGVDTTTPFDVTSTTATGLSTYTPNPPSIDHLNPAGLWTVIGVCSAHAIGSGTYTFPTGYVTNAVQVWGSDTTEITVGMGYNTAPADPEDPGTVAHSGTDSTAYAWCATTMALRPAAAGADQGTEVGRIRRGILRGVERGHLRGVL